MLDESYRKAGKLDDKHFAPKFDPERAGLMDAVSPFLLEGHPDMSVRVELYKLNVYGACPKHVCVRTQVLSCTPQARARSSKRTRTRPVRTT